MDKRSSPRTNKKSDREKPTEKVFSGNEKSFDKPKRKEETRSRGKGYERFVKQTEDSDKKYTDRKSDKPFNKDRRRTDDRYPSEKTASKPWDKPDKKRSYAPDKSSYGSKSESSERKFADRKSDKPFSRDRRKDDDKFPTDRSAPKSWDREDKKGRRTSEKPDYGSKSSSGRPVEPVYSMNKRMAGKNIGQKKILDNDWYEDDGKDDNKRKSYVKKYDKTSGSSRYSSSRDKGESTDKRPLTENRFFKPRKLKKVDKIDDGTVRLNRFLANAGICSRREADQLIASGVVKINGKIVTELGIKVGLDDVVQYGGQTLNREKKQYLLLNKPKNFITTTDDPEGRKTVLELIGNACKERLYPVGRLDRATSGLLLFTNDGDLAKRLTHPSHSVKKIYHVHLDKNLKKGDFMKIAEGKVVLEDGVAEVDEINYVGDGVKKDELGLVIHSGKNRIVRRIFESLDYKVVKLDRVSFAGLTKKDLPRGRYRFLTEKEVNFLKMI